MPASLCPGLAVVLVVAGWSIDRDRSRTAGINRAGVDLELIDCERVRQIALVGQS